MDQTGELAELDGSITFVVVIAASVLLSLQALLLDRAAVCRGDGEAPAATPLRREATALVIGALGFFLCLALADWEEAETRSDRRAGWAQVFSSALVLSAALIRYRSLKE